MATTMDRSKYRNPDMPIGYVKKGQPSLRYKYGVEIDGVHYVWAPYIYEAHIEEREDYATLSDLILSDEEVILESVKIVSKPGTSNSSIISTKSSKKEIETIMQEPSEHGGTRRKVFKHSKKGQASNDSYALDTLLSHMDVDPEKHEKKKKVTKSKKKQRIDYRSDRSYRRRPATHKRYTPSPSPSSERYLDMKDITDEIKQEPLIKHHLFRSYICETCNITMNSKLTYDTHVNGKRHRKNLKVKNAYQVVAQNIPATVVSEDQSKYPKPPPGILQEKVQKIAEIQHVIEKNVKKPCPGSL